MARVRTKQIDGYRNFLEVPGEEKGRIANALNMNIAARKQLDLFDHLTDEDRKKLIIHDREKFVDRKGKPLYLSVEDIQLVKALSSYIPFNSPEIMDYISFINKMDGNGGLNLEKDNESGKEYYTVTYDQDGKPIKREFTPIKILISVPQIAKDIKGDAKEGSVKNISDRLFHLQEIEQAQTFYIKGDGETEKFMIVSPLIQLKNKVFKFYSEIRSARGRKKEKGEKEESLLISVEVEFSPIFLHRAINEYCPIYKNRLFKVWRGNKTELFAMLLSDLESKWRQYYVAAIKAETAAKEEYKQLKKENKNEYYRKVAAAKKAARIYVAETITIRNRLTTNYKDSRKMARQFVPDLQRAIASLVEYGIITEESHITKDGQKVLFFFNPDFIADGIEKLLPTPKN